jgi:hypothetical protein
MNVLEPMLDYSSRFERARISFNENTIGGMAARPDSFRPQKMMFGYSQPKYVIKVMNWI